MANNEKVAAKGNKGNIAPRVCCPKLGSAALLTNDRYREAVGWSFLTK